ncbi:MAG: toxin HipA, partial [Flavobacteriaceae bacterium CG_4_8_14_3_um_filter_34_10]
ALNIDMDNNALDYELAKSVGEYFRLENNQMDKIIQEVLSVVATWKVMAKKIGIPLKEQHLISKAFRF